MKNSATSSAKPTRSISYADIYSSIQTVLRAGLCTRSALSIQQLVTSNLLPRRLQIFPAEAPALRLWSRQFGKMKYRWSRLVPIFFRACSPAQAVPFVADVEADTIVHYPKPKLPVNGRKVYLNIPGMAVRHDVV